LPPANCKLTGKIAGEEIGPGDACYIKTSDGKIYRSTGAANNAAARVRGFAALGCKAGEALTLYFYVTYRYGASLPLGEDLFLSATVPGGLATTAPFAGALPVAFVVDDTRIYVRQSTY